MQSDLNAKRDARTEVMERVQGQKSKESTKVDALAVDAVGGTVRGIGRVCVCVDTWGWKGKKKNEKTADSVDTFLKFRPGKGRRLQWVAGNIVSFDTRQM